MAAVNERLARFMFDHQADDGGATDAMRESAWADAGTHDFWLRRANAVVSFPALEACA